LTCLEKKVRVNILLFCDSRAGEIGGRHSQFSDFKLKTVMLSNNNLFGPIDPLVPVVRLSLLKVDLLIGVRFELLKINGLLSICSFI
jgi:hypothetical protein